MLWRFPEEDPIRMHPLILAYIGDAVFELFTRNRLAVREAKVNKIHREAIELVSAKAMAAYYQKLEPYLSVEEADILHRGRNAKTRTIKSAGVTQYHMSTGFEALVGYLFLSNKAERLERLLNILLEGEDDAGGSAVRQQSSPGGFAKGQTDQSGMDIQR